MALTNPGYGVPGEPRNPAPRVQQYFGTNHGTPAHLGALWAATPVGRMCMRCDEVIMREDDGWIYPVVIAVDKWDMRPIHRECDLLGVVGHIVGICPCTYDNDELKGLTTRELALLCLRKWDDYSLEL